MRKLFHGCTMVTTLSMLRVSGNGFGNFLHHAGRVHLGFKAANRRKKAAEGQYRMKDRRASAACPEKPAILRKHSREAHIVSDKLHRSIDFVRNAGGQGPTDSSFEPGVTQLLQRRGGYVARNAWISTALPSL